MSADSWREIAETTKMDLSEYKEVEKPERLFYQLAPHM